MSEQTDETQQPSEVDSSTAPYSEAASMRVQGPTPPADTPAATDDGQKVEQAPSLKPKSVKPVNSSTVVQQMPDWTEDKPAQDVHSPEDEPTDGLYSFAGTPSERVMARTAAANNLVTVEFDLWRERRGAVIIKPPFVRREASEWPKRAVDVFKLRYRDDSRLTRWFGETRLAEYEMRRRQVQLGGQADRDEVGMSPLTPLRIVAAVLAVLLLLALVGVVVFALDPCSTDPDSPLAGTTPARTDDDATDSSAASTDASTTGATTADLRVCKRFHDVWVWTNCSAECLPVGYSSKPASTAGGDCTRVRWQACYGPTACWNSSAHADKPIDKLNCTQNTRDFTDIDFPLIIKPCPASDTTYCHVFADGAKHKLYYGCYGHEFNASNSDVGCGKTIPNGECGFVAANIAEHANPKEGQLCCCYGQACNNKTLAQLAVNKTEAEPTCVAGLEKKDERRLVESLDNKPAAQHNCTLGDICVDYSHLTGGYYEHARGCHFSGEFLIGIQKQCAQRLHRYNSTCFKAQDKDKTEYGVCCCSGDNCTADNSFHYLFGSDNTTKQPRDECDYKYALVDGAPDDGGGAQVEYGCEAVLARVPAATDACELLGDGCFVTHDGDGKDVSLCCCPGVGCTPKDVLEFVANKQPTTTPPPTTRAPTDASTSTAATSEVATSEATAATTGAGDEATGGCRWVAVCLGVLFALLLVALLPVAYILYQFLQAKENERWVKLQDKVLDFWADEAFTEGIMACIDGMPGVTAN